MVFPATPLDTRVELQGVVTAGVWTDVTSYVVGADQIRIARGLPDEATRAERATCALTFRNDGRFSPRNPSGAYYGKIGRNTPVRASVRLGLSRMLCVAAGDYFKTPDNASVSITGDTDIRVDLELDTWHRNQLLAYKNTGSPQISWQLEILDTGKLKFTWSANGTATLTATSNGVIPEPHAGRKAVRVTIDVDNGAAGNTVAFYSADTISGTWAQISTSIVTAGTTSIFDSTSEVRVGDLADATFYAFKLLNGIAGTEVANPDFTAQTDGATSFNDAAGRTWTAQAGASITTRRYLFCGEVSSWPQSWDVTGKDVRTQVEAAGIFRRLGQGASPLRSALYRYFTGNLVSTTLCYWPCEDASGATQLASAVAGPAPMRLQQGTPSTGAFDGFYGSEATMTLQGTIWKAICNTNLPANDVQAQFLLHIPSDASVDSGDLLLVNMDATIGSFTVKYRTSSGGQIEVKTFSGKDAQGLVYNSGALFTGLNGKLLVVSVQVIKSGTNHTVTTEIMDLLTGTISTNVGGGTNAGIPGHLSDVTVSPIGGLLNNDVAVGHVAILNSTFALLSQIEPIRGYQNERAGARVLRLCNEQSIALRIIGDAAITPRMGPQPSGATLLEILQEAADADLGLLGEPADMVGVEYRCRDSLQSQAATLSLDYAAKHLSELAPVDDDQFTRNDVTVQRKLGSLYRQVLTSGALSTAAPPAGVGTYDETVTVNLAADGQSGDQASWRLHLGTVDEARYPAVGVALARSQFTAALIFDVLRLRPGDRLDVASLPAFLPPGPLSQLVLGVEDTLSNFQLDRKAVCAPYSPWVVANYGINRYTTVSSTLSASMTSGTTTASVATASGPLWSHADGDFDIRIGAERLTVTAISGATSPQTFTVVRSVNGVVQAHSSGDPVELWVPGVYAIGDR
jgi:hypothetical protein